MRERDNSSSSSSSSASISGHDHSSGKSSYSSWEETDEEDEEDEEAINARRSPYWPRYRYFMISHGYRLDTCRDVKKFYEDYWERRRQEEPGVLSVGGCVGYNYACRERDESALCRDVGLVSVLFVCPAVHASCLGSHAARLSFPWYAHLRWEEDSCESCWTAQQGIGHYSNTIESTAS